jgi:ribosomal protein S18 acetylase RimI-like enzyme
MTARADARPTGFERTATVRRLRDVSAIRARLLTARAFSAYALAYLDPRLFELSEFFEATYGQRWALVMHARGGLGASTVTLGDPAAVNGLLRMHPGPHQTFLTCETTHVDGLLASHNLWRPQTMLRMQVDRHAFVAPANPPAVRRLIDADAHDLNQLYATEGDGLRYSGRQVSEGIYFGAHVRGRLVAAAGTHIHSLREGVGVIGNVFTHPDFRGRGLGTSVTAAVAEQLLKACSLVVLNVDPANRTARHIYENLGFTEAGRLVEAMATRREAVPFLPFARRLIGRWRAHAPGLKVFDL